MSCFILKSKFAFNLPHMKQQPRLNNYLRRYRKPSGLSQGDVAFLLGCKDAAQVSRYERNQRLPSLRVAIAYQFILGIPLEELFPGIKEKVDKEATVRIEKLRSSLQERPQATGNNARAVRKFRWLAECERIANRPL